jgi:hypothetical protein
MKRDMDLVRDLMLFLEGKPDTAMISAEDIPMAQRNSTEIQYHLNLIYQAGFLNAEAFRSSTTSDRIIKVIPFDLTWQGHEFLDAVRDPEIWRQAKAGAASAGTASIQFIWGIAKALLRNAIREKTGFDLT